jgi:protein farnesyltransferase/geranylgeranyltransferase type-1 subunit alpha
MSYFRALYERGEISDRALWLTEKAIRLNGANYTAWQYRRRILYSKSPFDWRYELKLTREIALMISKNYQIYYHRQCIVDYMDAPLDELDFINECLEEDPKNIHVWDYRYVSSIGCSQKACFFT